MVGESECTHYSAENESAIISKLNYKIGNFLN